MGKSILAPATLLGLLLWTTPLAADPFAGRFAGSFESEEYRLILDSVGVGRYEGVITIGDEDVPLVARRHGDRLLGQVGIGGDSFEFSAELQGDTLLLRDDHGAVIRLDRDPWPEGKKGPPAGTPRYRSSWKRQRPARSGASGILHGFHFN